MTVLHIDLDNTLIYSYKHDIGKSKMTAEVYQGREISFLTVNTYENLKRIAERVLLVPTSTRSTEQYKRIDLQLGPLPYALTCNGGVLLINGKTDASWYQQSLALIRESMPGLQAARHFLERDARRNFELRFIEDLFLFTKCHEPESVTADLREILDSETAEAFHNGEKVYVIPRSLSKGAAVERFREYTGAGRVIAAGDSAFDISMLQAADTGIAPHGFRKQYHTAFPVLEMPGDRVFSDEMTDKILEICP